MIKLHFMPQTRALGALALLEEIGAPFDLHVMDLKAGENRRSGYLAVNPMGKVPAIEDDGALVAEQGAVYLHLADRFPEAKLAPAIGDRLRGPFLRWLFFYGSSFEPAVVDKALKREPAAASICPYGDYDTVMETLRVQLSQGPWILGETFSAADLLWGVALSWTMMFGIVPKLEEFTAYADRVNARPAVHRARARDAEIAAAQEAARGKA